MCDIREKGSEKPRSSTCGLSHFHTERVVLIACNSGLGRFQASLHKTDPSFEFDPEVTVFVDAFADLRAPGRRSIPLARCFDHKRCSSRGQNTDS